MACFFNLDRSLRKFFHWLGYKIGQNPWIFIIVTILLTMVFATGYQRVDYNYDPEYLFSPNGGDAKTERNTVETYFPTNFSDFKASRITRPGKFGRVIIAAKDGGSMLRTALWNQLLYLDQVIYNVTVVHEGNPLKYAQLCAQWNGYCYDNEILRMASLMPSIEAQETKITYPIFFDPFTFETYTLPIFFGGITLTPDEIHVEKVNAIGLSYFLDVSEPWLMETGDVWERQFLKDVEKFADQFYPDLKVGMFVSNTPAWEMENSKLSVTEILCINVALMAIFSILAPLVSDAAQSKPWVGFFGLFSACLATLAGFGFCCYIGVEWITMNLAAPFLLFGIGFDDTFVMLSAWRRSPSHLSVPERMARTYTEAGVSITFTSLTNVCCCLMSCMTPFPCIRIFCIYTGVAMAFTYIWHITMFGGVLALAGRAEAKNKHGLFLCKTVTPKSKAQHRSWLYRTFMTGGINAEDPMNPLDNQEHAGMAFFRDKLGNWLNIGWVKVLILTLFSGYLIGGIWGCTQIQEGLEKRNTANYDSYSVQYYDMDDAYFKKYAFTISVVISGPALDFSSKATQQQIETIVQALENSPYIDKNLTQNWLRDFLDYIDRNKGYSDVHLPVETSQEFTQTLKSVYLADPNNPARLDVSFTDDGASVQAARFLIQGHNIVNSKIEQLMVADLREICARYSTDELQVTVFQPFFIYIDQYLAILPQTLQTIFVTAAVMVLISMLLIPNFACALWVSFSIVSIEIGVVGYMTWWGVRLDGVALINLIMCIGFSVDFSAHICYHYLTAVSHDESSGDIVENNISLSGRPEDRIKASLYALGIPILQGAMSTILGVLGLAFAPSYLFVTFFKMIFLVIMLGAFHGMILLPVLLSLMGPGSCSKSSTTATGRTSTRSSGLSTPTLNAITCHRDPQKSIESHADSCYTINLGYVSHDQEPSQFVPYHYHQYLQRQNYSMQVQMHGQPEPLIHSTEQSSPSTSSSSSASQKRNQGIRKKQAHKHHHHKKQHHKHRNHQLQLHPMHMMEALSAYNNVDLIPKETCILSQQSEHNRQLDLHLAALSRMQQRSTQKSTHHQHKKVGRSRSHRPGPTSTAIVSTLPEGGQQLIIGLPSNFAEKPVLRKHHSFPYEMFNNETSYSSDDSLRN